MLLSAVTQQHRSQADHHLVCYVLLLHLLSSPLSVKGPLSAASQLPSYFRDHQGSQSSVLIWELSNENILKLHKSMNTECVCHFAERNELLLDLPREQGAATLSVSPGVAQPPCGTTEHVSPVV